MTRYRLLLIAFFSCLWSHAAVAEIKAVASFSILADMVQQVAGEDAQVSSIVGPDADAHLYSPNAADAIAVTKADIIFVNGLGFETWSSDLIANSGTTAPVVTVTEKVIPLMVEGSVDPHAWNDIRNGILYVEAIAKGLSQVDPANAAAYQARAEAYIKRLTALDAEAKDLLAPIAPEKRIVVTAHDAFGYLANAYDMTFLAPVGIDTEAEPSAKEMAALITYLNEVKANALFVENITNDSLIKQISAETGIEIGGRIYSDALSVKGSPATSYLAMFKHNISLLADRLAQ